MILPLQLSGQLEKAAPWFAAVVVLVTAVWASEPYPVGVFHDDGVYVTLAKSLATGEGLRYLNLPGAPVATHYPPIYPLLLAGLWKLAPDFPRNIPLFQLANAIALALTALGVATFARRVLAWPQPAAVIAALVGTLSYPLIGLSGHVLSETLFAAVLFPALILAERAVRNPSGARDALLAGAAAGILTLVRTHGVALVAALVIAFAWRRQFRLAAFAAGAAVLTLVPWQLFVAAHDAAVTETLRGKYGSYLPWLLDGLRGGVAFVGATIAANVREIIALLADRFSLSDYATPRLATGLIAAIFIVAGAIRLARRAPVTALFAALYVVILLFWPWTPWRFFYAVWPIVIVSLGEAIRWLADARPRAAAPASAGLVVVTILALGAARAETRAYYDRTWNHAAQRAARMAAPLINWVASNTRSNDVVAVEAEQIVYLFTGRLAVPPMSFTAAEYVTPATIPAATESLRRVLAEFPVTFVVTSAPHVYRSARLLAESARTNTSTAHLVPLQTFPRWRGGGGAFRVERNDSSNSLR